MSQADERALSHVLLPRFNLPSPGLESLVRAQDGWLRARWDLFSRSTVRTLVMRQLGKNGLDRLKGALTLWRTCSGAAA